MNEGTGVVPVMDVGNNRMDGFGYGGGWFLWIIIIFALMGGGFGGFGGWNNRGIATQADVYAANDSQSMRTAINNLGNGICDSTYALNTGMLNGFNATQRDIMAGNNGVQRDILGGFNNTQVQGLQNTYALKDAIVAADNNIMRGLADGTYAINTGINQNRFEMSQGFCGVGRNIDAVRYDNAMGIQKLTENGCYNTQKILDKLTAMENNAKDAEIANLRQQVAGLNLAFSQQKQNADLTMALKPCPVPAYLVSNPYCNCNCGAA